MKELLIQKIQKHWEIIIYGIIGMSTTLINFMLYHLFTRVAGFNYMAANIAAYIIALLYAFVTNKYIVFKSRQTTKEVMLHETIAFFGMRGIAGILDSVLMYIGVNRLEIRDTFVKLAVTFLIIIFNYFVSKLVVFTKSNKKTP